jgi:hypothetical protein
MNIELEDGSKFAALDAARILQNKSAMLRAKLSAVSSGHPEATSEVTPAEVLQSDDRSLDSTPGRRSHSDSIFAFTPASSMTIVRVASSKARRRGIRTDKADCVQAAWKATELQSHRAVRSVS